MNQNEDLTLKKLVFSALFHDIGKLSDRARYFEKEEYKRIKNKYSTEHSINTELLLNLIFKENNLPWHDGKSLSEIAAEHHEQNINDISYIIHKADMIAAGHERRERRKNKDGKLDIEGETSRFNKPLLSIFEKVNFNENKQTDKNLNSLNYFHYVNKINDFDKIFPINLKNEKFNKKNNEKNYNCLINEFINEIENFYKKNINKKIKDEILNFNITFNNLLKKYLSFIPESAKISELQDVSLYDHSRLTAMISTCIYVYYKQKGLIDNIKDEISDDDNIYILFGIDISGIQNFIYNIPSTKAYIKLKARSFLIQFLPEIIITRLLNKIGLDQNQVIFSTGGQAYLLLPNTERIKEIIINEMEKINEELFEFFRSKLFVRYDFVELSNIDLIPIKNNEGDKDNKINDKKYIFKKKWVELRENLGEKDRRKYSLIARKSYNKIFFPEFDKKNYFNFEDLGRDLRGENINEINNNNGKENLNNKKDKFLLLFKIRNNNGVNKINFNENFNANIYSILKYNFAIFNNKEKLKEFFNLYSNEFVFSTIYILSGDFDISKIEGINTNFVFYPVSGLEGFTKEFHEIAKNSRGSDLLGILRMDVDNLGKIFANGLKENFYTIGRMTTLSSMLTYFFSFGLMYIINNKIKEINSKEKIKKECIVVYSGGDDLFLIGNWDIIPEISLEIYNKFKEFTTNNNDITMSGGIALIKGKYPIYRAARKSGDYEERAKNYIICDSDNKIIKQKDAITFLDQSLSWEEFKELYNEFFKEIRTNLKNKQTNENKLKPLINRILLISNIYYNEYLKLKIKYMNCEINEIYIRKLAYTEKWLWRMVYSLSRWYKENETLKEIGEKLMNYFKNKIYENKYGIENSFVLGKWLELYYREK